MEIPRGRRITQDNRGRVPFAVLAVIIFLLSSFSSALLGDTIRKEMVNHLLESELRDLEEIVVRLQIELRSAVYLISNEAILRFLKERNSPTHMDEEMEYGALNSTFQELLTAHLLNQYPRQIDHYIITEIDHRINLLPNIKRVWDLTPAGPHVISESADHGANDLSRLDLTKSQEYHPTNATHSYIVSGYVNLSVECLETALKQNKTLWVEVENDTPLPFLLAKMESFNSNYAGGMSEVARLTKYILTTLAQYKALQGYGMKTSNLPDEIVDKLQMSWGDATGVLTLNDVELAVNIAVFLETLKSFRSWDPDVLDAIDNQTRVLASALKQFPPARSLRNLMNQYASKGSIDAADLVSLFLDLGGEGVKKLNFEAILAQTLYTVLDSFMLRYLDYFGLMPLVDEAWRGVQLVDGVLRQAGVAIDDLFDWFTGKTSTNWNKVLRDWLNQTFVSRGKLEEDYFLRLLVQNRSGSRYNTFQDEIIDSYPSIDVHEGGFDLTLIVRLTDGYHTWYNNGSEYPHRYRLCKEDSIVGYDYVRYTVEINFNSSHQQIHLTEIDIASEIEDSDIWLNFYETYFLGRNQEKSAPKTLRESIKSIIDDISADAIRRVEEIDRDETSIRRDPSDDVSFLSEVGNEINSTIRELIDFYKSETGKDAIKRMLSSYLNPDITLLEELKYFLNREFERFINKTSLLNSVIDQLALELIESRMFPTIKEEERISNANISFDWSFHGNLTPDLLPLELIRENFLNGGVESEEQFTDLKSRLTDDVNSAYEQVKNREVGIGSYPNEKGVLIQAIEEAEKAENGFFLSIIGGATEIMDGIGLLDMALSVVDTFLGGIRESAAASNVQYLLPVRHGYPFEFWEEGWRPSKDKPMDTLSFSVDQIDNYLRAEWSNIEPGTRPLPGRLLVDFNISSWTDGDVSYDTGDINGNHYTDILSFSREPYETRWDIAILGAIPLRVGTEEKVLFSPRGHQSLWLNNSIELNFSINVLVYTGWELEGVDYTATDTFLAEILDFLDVAWDWIKKPITNIIDYIQIIGDFLRGAYRTLLEYGSYSLSVLGDGTDIAISLLQRFLSNILSSASLALTNLLTDLGLEHFEIEVWGLSFEVDVPRREEREDCQCVLIVKTRGGVFDQDFHFTTLIMEFEKPVEDMSMYIVSEGVVRFGSRGHANFTIDPFMVIHEHLVEIHAVDQSVENRGWMLTIIIPELDIYQTTGMSLSDVIGFVPSVPIPLMGVEVGIDFGVSLKHLAMHPRYPFMNLRLALLGVLKESIIDAWLGIDKPPTLDSIQMFLDSLLYGFSQRLRERFEESLIEVFLYLDVSLSALGTGGAASGGFRIGIVADKTAVFQLIQWIAESIHNMLENLDKPLPTSIPANLPNNILENIGIRFEVYFEASYPRMLTHLSSELAQKKMDAAISIQPNLPSVARLVNLNWGSWKADFGIYLENFPLSSLGRIESMNKNTIVDLYLLKGQVQELSSSRA